MLRIPPKNKLLCCSAFHLPLLRIDSHFQEACGKSGEPVLRIVSLNADNTNRGHAFDMDIADLEKEGQPIPYQEARRFFRTDPSQRCPPMPLTLSGP